MKRLIDEEYAPGSSESLLAELVRATPPFEPATLERRRVFDLGTVAARRQGALSVRVGAAVLLLGSAAAAAVTVEHSRTGAHSASPVAMASAGALPVVAPTSVEPVSPIGVEAPGPLVAPRVSSDAPSTRLKTVARPTSTSFRQGEDPAPVLEAIRALRSQGDAARAGVLLAEYLKAHPHSVLSEDALALSIESAVARHDMRAANDFSRRYLAQFPNGRYRAFALRATAP